MTEAVSENVTIEKSSVASSLSTAASAALFASSIAWPPIEPLTSSTM